MYHPTTRVLTLLELLQSHREISGPEIAARLEVDVRTVRRYVVMLQDLGIPVEAERGRYGTYRLMPGFKLPPLMFSEDEALAVTLGLLVTREIGMGLDAPPVEGALAKIQRVMPETLRDRLRALQDSLTLSLPIPNSRPNSEIVMTMSAAVQAQRRVWVRYRAYQASESEREIDPYGLVFRAGFWYAAGYCHLRHDLRTFRLDRMVEVRILDQGFERPADFDALDQVERSIAQTPGNYWIDVLLHTTLADAKRHIPRDMANLEEAEGDDPAGRGVLLRFWAQDIDWCAHFVMGLPCHFTIREPDALRAALRRLAARIIEQVGM